MSAGGWIGVDLDGTLAHYAGWKGADHIGAPIPVMVQRVRRWLKQGRTVKIFTARVGATDDVVDQSPLPGTLIDSHEFAETQRRLIQEWCERHIGQRLEVTATKDYGMDELWDDRAIRVEMNTGRMLSYGD
jgi:hypothetical protein